MTGHPGPARTLAVQRLRNAWGQATEGHAVRFVKPAQVRKWERRGYERVPGFSL